MDQPKLITTPFAQDAPAGAVDPIPETLAPSDPIQNASWSVGFPNVTMIPLAAGGIPPRGQSMNGVLKAISEHSAYVGSGGQYKWDQDWVDAKGGYAKGAVLQSDDGLASYVSAVDNNTDNFNTDPASIGTSWLPYSGAVKIDSAGTGLIQDGTALRVNFGTTAGTAMQGNDSRVSGALQKTAVVQSAGTSTTEVMSQKAVTDELKEIAEALGTNFIKPVRGAPLLTKVSPVSVMIPSGLSATVAEQRVVLEADITLSLDSDLVGSTAVPGTDYFVYLKPDATAYISASDVESEGRLIAGFHYGLTGHAEAPSGNKTEADMVKLRGINAHTFWDLTFRANKWTNRGLTFDGINWIDIYLADEEYAVRGWSKAGGWIAGGKISNGRKFPVIPEMFGGNGVATYGKLTPFVAWDMLNAAGMEPISYKQFAHAMYGVEEGLPADGIETVIGKIEHYPRLTSRYGVEQATGVQWIWGADFGSSSSDSWNNITDGRGQVYSGVTVSLYGARRADAAGRPGSRASNWNARTTSSGWGDGVRGLRDHLILD